MGYPAGRAKLARHDDPLFSMLARSFACAFKLAEDDDPIIANTARRELCAFFSRHNLVRLYRQGFISWEPDTFKGV